MYELPYKCTFSIFELIFMMEMNKKGPRNYETLLNLTDKWLPRYGYVSKQSKNTPSHAIHRVFVEVVSDFFRIYRLMLHSTKYYFSVVKH